MPSVRRLREIFSTLRFRLVLWITLVVFLMVVVTNITVREVEQRALAQSYDQFLIDSLEDIHLTVTRPGNEDLVKELDGKVRVFFYSNVLHDTFESPDELEAILKERSCA